MSAPRATRSSFSLKAFWMANIYLLVYFEMTKGYSLIWKKENITINPSHFVSAIPPDCGVLKVLRSMPEGVRLQKQHGTIGKK